MPYFATGRIRCLENDVYPSFEIVEQSSAYGSSCSNAKQAIQGYFTSADRCKYSAAGTFYNRRWDGNITWVQTTTCP